MSMNSKDNTLKQMRGILREYGVSKDESMVDALRRLVSEHKQALADAAFATIAAREAEERAAAAKKEAQEARENRDLAYRAADLAARDRSAVRNALDLLLPLLPDHQKATVEAAARGGNKEG